jgi:hypothetical protein
VLLLSTSLKRFENPQPCGKKIFASFALNYGVAVLARS